MPPRANLDVLGREFARTLSRVLNTTITDGIPLSAIFREDGSIGWVGYGITKKHPTPGNPIPLPSATDPCCYLHVIVTLELDEHLPVLVVDQAAYGLYLDDEMRDMVFHYDYARDPENDYPVAHVQVAGDSQTLRELSARCKREMELEELHFPVGGRRFRTSVEDVVEFLIVERIVPAREGWEDVIRAERARFHEIQTAAAARRFPKAAAEGLRRQGWRVEPPPETSA